MTSCSAPTRAPGLLGASSEEEAAFQVQMQTAVCFLQLRVTHVGTRKPLLCLDSLSPNPNLGKAALSSLNTRLWVAGARKGRETNDIQREQGPEQRGNSGWEIFFFFFFLPGKAPAAIWLRGLLLNLWIVVCLFFSSLQLIIFIKFPATNCAGSGSRQTCAASTSSRPGSRFPFQGGSSIALVLSARSPSPRAFTSGCLRQPFSCSSRCQTD